MSYAEAASFLRAALLLGLLSPEDVIAWSDQIIREDPCPPAFTYTLSLTRPELSSVREVLRPVALSAEPLGVIEAVLGLAARDMASGRRTVDDTLRVLTQLRRFLELDRDSTKKSRCSSMGTCSPSPVSRINWSRLGCALLAL